MEIIPLSMMSLFLSTSASSQTEIHNSISSMGIKGNNPNAHFSLNETVNGSNLFTIGWSEINWKFCSKEHLDRLKPDPLIYIPQY